MSDNKGQLQHFSEKEERKYSDIGVHETNEKMCNPNDLRSLIKPSHFLQ
jgi:hypothetical protein